MADFKNVANDEIERLKAEVKRLQDELADAKVTSSEDIARRAAFYKDDSDEVPTGRTIKVMKAKKPWSRADDIEYDEVDQPTFYYKIDMPPVGGVDIKINGESFQHGQVYEVTLDQLRYLKEVCYRLRDHEANIHGTDENIYRPKSHATFSGRVNGRIR
jgi:hypothetical protein